MTLKAAAQMHMLRENFMAFGKFDVKITIDKKLYLTELVIYKNQNEIGYNYQDEGVKVKFLKTKKITWHFVAIMVHDFTWVPTKLSS
jgi:hypothetical protein